MVGVDAANTVVERCSGLVVALGLGREGNPELGRKLPGELEVSSIE